MNSNARRTAVVILNWNGKAFLEKFLSNVVRFSEDDAEVIVADNDSTDDSVEFVQKHFPSVRLIQLEENSGYAGGYNKALEKLNHQYFILLNSDVEVTQSWISPLIKFMDENPKVSACQPKILSWHHRDEFEYAGAAGGYIDKYGYPFCRGRIFNTIEKDHGQYDDAVQTFWASGACMFVRSEVFRKLRGFDESFFAHMEEIDLCWRMKKLNYEIWFYPQSRVYHVGGGTLDKNNPRKTYLNFRNNLLMLYKNLDAKEFVKVKFFRNVADFLAAIRFLFNNSLKDCLAVLKAHIDFNKMKVSVSPSVKNPENTGQQEITGILKQSILFSFYVRKLKKFSDINASKGLKNQALR
ncbi:MAG: glycosyltransferase family 2 protein [Bacteroidetes bacterium]|nr:MAG: glycosyltransferase family 2 protein [Bacteroidota bacterium]REK06952.1 MAG: glycosyltransferase family 2 protein [Bacteroidota bacterium]REK33700.1 MAG: glycosyltransferase family 2 protein [Bacteroidota bacterium]REK47223.1 MAG: glycosyltransferase family 2 protein [Bacteroidota bacterium]